MRNFEDDLPDYTQGEYLGYLRVQSYIEYLEQIGIPREGIIVFIKSYLKHEQGAIKNGWRV